jgi:hypothetical protein
MRPETKKQAVALGLTIGVVAGLILGGLFIGSMTTADNALDRFCYQELGPEWQYSTGTAQYWNHSLDIKCVKNLGKDREKTQNLSLGVKQ